MKNFYKLNLSKYSTHNIIRSNVGSNKTVLDVGCNDGYIGKISDSTNRFYGLDASEESVGIAQEIYEKAIQYDLNHLIILPWDVKFDVIIFADVLEHVLYPETVLNYFVKNYLKEDGKVIISLPNIANWRIRLDFLFGKFDYTDSGIMDRTHLHLYTYKTAFEFMSKSNLKIERVLGGASIFGFIISVMPFLKSLLSTNIIIIIIK